MRLDQRLHAEAAGESQQLGKLGVVQQRADQEHGVCSGGARLVDLIGIEEEVFAQHGEVHGGANGTQVVERAEEEVRLSEHADGGGASRRVGARLSHWVELLAEQPL